MNFNKTTEGVPRADLKSRESKYPTADASADGR